MRAVEGSGDEGLQREWESTKAPQKRASKDMAKEQNWGGEEGLLVSFLKNTTWNSLIKIGLQLVKHC